MLPRRVLFAVYWGSVCARVGAVEDGKEHGGLIPLYLRFISHGEELLCGGVSIEIATGMELLYRVLLSSVPRGSIVRPRPDRRATDDIAADESDLCSPFRRHARRLEGYSLFRSMQLPPYWSVVSLYLRGSRRSSHKFTRLGSVSIFELLLQSSHPPGRPRGPGLDELERLHRTPHLLRPRLCVGWGYGTLLLLLLCPDA